MKTIFLFLFLLIPILSRANPLGGGTHWHQTTPGGYDIGAQNSDIVTLFVFDSDYNCMTGHSYDLNGLSEWYFYKKHIVGKLDKEYTIKKSENCQDITEEGKDNAFFIINEITRQYEIFSSEAVWKDAIKKQGIKPFIWTRWYEFDDFDSSGGIGLAFAFLYLLLFGSYIGIILLGIYAIYKAIKTKKYLHLIILLSTSIILFVAVLVTNIISGFGRTQYIAVIPASFIISSLIYFIIFINRYIKMKRYRSLKVVAVVLLLVILWIYGNYLLDTYPQSI